LILPLDRLRQHLDAAALIVAGVAVINLLSKSVPH
jgi:hypothetical protein